MSCACGPIQLFRKKKKQSSFADKLIEHGMEGRVVAIHGISIGAHSREYRYKLYEKMRSGKNDDDCLPNGVD